MRHVAITDRKNSVGRRLRVLLRLFVQRVSNICSPGCNIPLHQHRLFSDADVYNHGKPTRIVNAVRDVRLLDGNLPVSDGISVRLYSIPWFKHFRKNEIEQHALAFRKVAENYKELLADDPGNPQTLGGDGACLHGDSII